MSAPAPAPIVTPGEFPGDDPARNAIGVCDLVERGSEPDRDTAARLLAKDSRVPMDRGVVRERLLLLLNKYKPAVQPDWNDAEALKVSNARAWMLYLLPRVADGEPAAAAVLNNALDPQIELNKWCRYWALAGLIHAGSSQVQAEAEKIVANGDNDLVLMLAHAVLAHGGEPASLDVLRKGLSNPDLDWATLRALRIRPIDSADIVRTLCNIIERGDNSDVTYDAIKALSRIGAESDYARTAGRTLGDFVDRWSSYEGRDSMRQQALYGIGRLRRSSEVEIVCQQLLDPNPAIVRQAVRALEAILGARGAVDRVLAAAAGTGKAATAQYAMALRWLSDRAARTDQLFTAMLAGSPERREIARTLLSEVGGAEVVEKLKVQSNLMNQHAAALKQSDDRIHTLFTTSMDEAQTGFHRSLRMDQTVFYMGVALIGVSAALALVRQGALSADWVGTGTTGVLGVLYTLFLARPRQQVQAGVDHLMKLKVIFLGFLRQLHQADSAYIRRLLEDEPVSTEELKAFTDVLEQTIQKANEQLKAVT